MALPEFRNEAYTDFNQEPNRKAMVDALDRVGRELGKEFPLIIGDQRLRLDGRFTSWNPSLKTQVVAVCQKATVQQVNQAVETADRAFTSWSRVPAEERAAVLLRAADILRRRKLWAAALAGGWAHIASAEVEDRDEVPQDAGQWGWQLRPVGKRKEWQPQGRRIGWRDGDDLLLEPEAAYAVAQQVARDQGTSLGLSPKTLWKYLLQQGHIAASDPGRTTVKRTIGKQRRRVVHIHIDVLSPRSGAIGAGRAEASRQIRNEPQSAPLAAPLSGASTEKAGHKAGQLHVQEPSSAPTAPNAPLLREEKPIGFSQATSALDEEALVCYVCGAEGDRYDADGRPACANHGEPAAGRQELATQLWRWGKEHQFPPLESDGVVLVPQGEEGWRAFVKGASVDQLLAGRAAALPNVL